MTKRATVTTQELAILASSCGLVANTDDGRQAFTAWLAKDQKAARKALFTRVAARRAAASAAAKASASPYPRGWAPKAAKRASSVRSAGVSGRRARITEGND